MICKNSQKKIWLIGGTGFIGTNMQVFYSNSETLSTGRNVSVMDCGKLNECFKIFRPNRIIYLAGVTTIQEAELDPKKTIETNYQGFKNVVNAALDYSFSGKILYVSSSEVYGKSAERGLSFGENSPTIIHNAYSQSKLLAEEFAQTTVSQLGINIKIARPFNQIGPNQSPRFLLPRLARDLSSRAKSKSVETLTLRNSNSSRDFIDVRDAITAYDSVLESGIPGRIYNICSAKSLSVFEIVEMLKVVAKLDLDCLKVTSEDCKCDHALGDNTRIKTELNWTPKFDIMSTLNDIYKECLNKK